jgi:ribosome-associated protein YbcJ (S4-like RNA binding protein)
MLGLLKKSQTIALVVVGLLIFASACTHRKVVQLGSHTVTVSRHGFEKKLYVNEKGSVPTLEYEGVSTAGSRLKVTIMGDKVRVNDQDYGKLRQGDSVLIGDDGIAVNSLDYGESEKYLQANNSTSEASVRN